jgi:hypothetical protein
MSTRALFVVAAAAVLLAGLALYGHNRSATSGGPGGGSLFLPGLQAELDDVDQVQIQKAGREVVATLKRGDKGWVVDEKGGYPADVAKIGKALLDLAQAKVVEQKTSDPDYYDRLGVEPITEDTASGTAVSVSGPENPPAAIILGGTEGDYRYARLADQPRSYLLDKNPEVPRETPDWLDPEILDVPGNRVQQVTIRHDEGEILTISKEDAAQKNFAVADVPDGRELLYPGVADVIGNSLRELKLEDVAAKGDADDAPHVTTRFRTFDGLVVTAKGYDRDDGSWLSFAASVDPDRLPKDADPNAGNGNSEPAKAEPDTAASDTTTAADIRDEADKINARVAGWLYQIPSYQYDQMTRQMADLLKADKAKSAD